MYRLFPCIPIFRRGGGGCVVGLKIVLLLVKNLFFDVKKGMSEFLPKNILISPYVSYLRKKKLHGRNHGPNFTGGSSSN